MNKTMGRLGKFIKEAPVIAAAFIIWGISILLMLTAVPVAYWPHYEKAVYEKEEYPANVVTKDIRGLDDFSSILDWDWELDYFSFEIDVEDLEPTGFYLEGYQFSTPSTGSGGVGRYRKSGTVTYPSYGPPEYTWNWWEMLFYRKNSIYTQFYSLELADGNTVLVRLSDTAMDIPKSGKLEIPVATWSTLYLGDSISRGTEGDDAEKKLIRKYHLETDSMDNISYIDASNWWIGYNSELVELCEQREEIFLGMMISGLFGLLIGFVVLMVGIVRMSTKSIAREPDERD